MMGTLVDVIAYPDGDSTTAASIKALERMGQLEKGAYRKKLSSPVVGDEDLAKILNVALEVSRVSSGAFDPTLGEVVALWGFDSPTPHLPDSTQISVALESVGYQVFDHPSGDDISVSIDLGGVTKGYAVDEAVGVLQDSGVIGGIVNGGGDLRTFGLKPGGKLWKIGVQDPDNPQELAGVLSIREAAVATSGDYQRYFEEAGVRYHHILDPATGYPARSGLRGTTVIAPDCALADALATAAFVLGPEKGLKLLEEWDDVEGVLITDDGEVKTTSGIGGIIPFEER
jgi:thiamine biosynthesis lipoprotein